MIGDKKMRGTQEKFLETMQERCLALNLHVWSRATINSLDQALQKDDRVHQEREDKLCDMRRDYVEDQKLSENKEEQLRPTRTLEAKEGNPSPKDGLKGRRRYRI